MCKIIRHFTLSYNIRKWRFILPLVKRPAIFSKQEDIKSRLNELLDGRLISAKVNEKQTLAIADKAFKHQFSVLGSPLVQRGKIPWHEDIKSGYVWPQGKYYRDYKIVDSTNTSDVKVPWEISRCHHLLYLGQAYRITKDEKYAKEVIVQILDWIDHNPLMHSINWTCSMEVAIRAVNWMWALHLISTSGLIDDSFTKRISKSLYEHGFFIFHNLENYDKYNANHYFSDIVGLLFIGSLLYKNKQAKKWFDFALQEFQSEIRIQFLPSGFHYERSISYHRLMTELAGYSWGLLNMINVSLPMDVKNRIERMFMVVAAYLKPNGMAPNIGDEDDGRFLPFVKCDFHYHAYLLDLYHSITGKVLDGKRDHITVYNDAGFVVVRQNGDYLFISNGGVSKYPELDKWNVTHSHCDLLSFEYFTNGKDVIVDPGTFAYTSDFNDRLEFKSTKKHNTVQIDGVEQYGLDKNKPFALYVDSLPTGISIDESNSGILRIIAEYCKHTKPLVYKHKRVYTVSKSELKVEDEITSKGNHTYRAFLHLPNGQLKGVKIMPSAGCLVKEINDSVSTSYGVKHPSKTLILEKSFTDKIVSSFEIVSEE